MYRFKPQDESLCETIFGSAKTSSIALRETIYCKTMVFTQMPWIVLTICIDLRYERFEYSFHCQILHYYLHAIE